MPHSPLPTQPVAPGRFMAQYPEPGRYARAMRDGFAHTRAGGTVRMERLGHPMDAAQFTRDFRTALHRRINRKGCQEADYRDATPTRARTRPQWEHGRKFSPEYQVQQARDARAIHDYRQRRIRFSSLGTPSLRRRFADLLADLRSDW